MIGTLAPEIGVDEPGRSPSSKGRGVFLVRRSGEIVHGCPFALAYLGERESCWEGKAAFSLSDGRLRLNDAQQQVKFLACLGDVAYGRRLTCGMSLARGQGRLGLTLIIQRTVTEHMVLVTLCDPEWSSTDEVVRLQECFGLTRREAEVASYLSAGKTLLQFAESRFLTLNTVKSHLKHIFRKLDVRNQVQLVAVVRASAIESGGVRSNPIAIAINEQAHVLHISPAARQALVTNRWPIQVHERRLAFIDRALQRRFLQDISKLVLTSTRYSQPNRLMVPVPYKGIVMLMSVRWCSKSGSLLLSLDEPWHPSDEDRALLSAIFGFTPRESEVAANLARGLTLKDYVEQSSMTTNTVKTHLKQIFLKARVRRQTQLVAVVRALLV